MCLFPDATAQRDLKGLGIRSSSEAKGKEETGRKEDGGCISYTRHAHTHVKRTRVHIHASFLSSSQRTENSFPLKYISQC